MTLDRPLRSHSDFLKLWAAQTVSLFGSQVTMLALPLIAILTLHARPLEVGVLNAAGSAAALVASLPAGVWIDRLRRRPAMIAASLGQALVLASIPVAAWLGVLRLPQLVVVAFLAATFAVFFNVAYRAYVPSLVPRSRLIDANSRLAASKNAAQIGGSGLAGALIQVFGAPVAILADSLSFVLSSLTLLAIRTPESKAPATERAGIRREGVEGVRTLLGNRVLRSLAAASATFNLFDGVLFAVYVLFMSRELRLSAGIIGLIFGLAGAGGLAGTFAVAPLTGRLGLGRAILWGVLLATAGELLIAGAHGPPLIATLILLAAEALVELGAGLYAINASSLQQAVIPEHLRGRVLATIGLISTGAGPIGSLLGGLLGEHIGLRGTILVAGCGTLLSLPWVLFPSVRRLREAPV